MSIGLLVIVAVLLGVVAVLAVAVRALTLVPAPEPTAINIINIIDPDDIETFLNDLQAAMNGDYEGAEEYDDDEDDEDGDEDDDDPVPDINIPPAVWGKWATR